MLRKLNEECHCKYLEFPELIFTSDDKGNIYFDATAYIEKKGDSAKHFPADFIQKHSAWIEAAYELYSIEKGHIFFKDNSSGHIFIDESLALLFVAYIEPEFGVYMLERMSELFLNGFVVSDSLILNMASNRLNLETQ